MNARTDIDDVDLWDRAQAGAAGADAFAALFDRHANAVYRYSYVRTSDPAVAEEIVAIVFSEAWRQRDRIELLDGSLRPWLITVARNQANRHHRRQTRQRTTSSTETAYEDHAERVATATDAQSELRRVLEAIDRLPDAPRETLVLHVWGGLTHAEIATELGISTGTVKSRLNRARARLGRQQGDSAAVISLHGDVQEGVQDA